MNIFPAFSVPVWESEFPEFEQVKSNMIKATKVVEQQQPSLDHCLYLNGYQSARNSLNSQQQFFPVFDYVSQAAIQATVDMSFVNCQAFITESWANIGKSNSSVLMNANGRDTFTAIFFYNCPEGTGNLTIYNPSNNPLWQGNMLVDQKNSFTSEKLNIQPKEGQLILFPSYLSYGIEPNNHNEESMFLTMQIIALPEDVAKNMVMGMPNDR